MKFTVFFREGTHSVLADTYLPRQPREFQDQLRQAAEMLSTTGRIEGFRSGLSMNGDWSIWLENSNGERFNFVLFVSQLEAGTEAKSKASVAGRRKPTLVIVDPGGGRDSAGGAHPGHWSIEHYASLMDEMRRGLFFETISLIEAGAPSPDYVLNENGTISIRIDRPEASVRIDCVAKWI